MCIQLAGWLCVLVCDVCQSVGGDELINSSKHDRWGPWGVLRCCALECVK